MQPGKKTSKAAFSGFTNRAHEPGRRAAMQILARARAAWDDLETHLAETYSLRGSFYFMYGERYGWALRFRRAGRTMIAMYPNRSLVTVQIILNNAQVAAARAMGLPTRVLAVLESAKDYPEGRWLFIPVKSLVAARELRALVALKLLRPKRGRASGDAQRETRSSRAHGCN